MILLSGRYGISHGLITLGPAFLHDYSAAGFIGGYWGREFTQHPPKTWWRPFENFTRDAWFDAVVPTVVGIGARLLGRLVLPW